MVAEGSALVNVGNNCLLYYAASALRLCMRTWYTPTHVWIPFEEDIHIVILSLLCAPHLAVSMQHYACTNRALPCKVNLHRVVYRYD